jgi:hypothetical protein
MSAVDRLLARVGKTRAQLPPRSKLGAVLHRGGVRNTPEVQRILALPSYRWQDDSEIEALGAWLDRTYGFGVRPGCQPRCGHMPLRDGCPECSRARHACACCGTGEMHLHPVQTAALQAIHDHGGLFAVICVGGGKTLITYLAGVIRGVERTLLVIPAALRQKTLRDFARLKRHWVGPQRLHIISYELLSRDRGLAELEAFRPDLVVADESHRFKNNRAVCTIRLHKYLTKTNPDAAYAEMSGTTTTRSILEYHHRSNWALQENMPLPQSHNEASEWAGALDEDPAALPLLPGALLQFCSDDEIQSISADPSRANTLQNVRAAYARRLLTAPGVVGSKANFAGAMSLRVTGHEFRPAPVVLEAFQRLRDCWERPDGHPIESPADLWRHARELIQGFWYRWEPPPPQEWLLLRKEWGATCRQVLRDFRDIESPLIATRAIDDGRIPWACEALENWRAVKDTYQPTTVAEWIDDTCLRWAERWARHREPGIVWTWESAFANKLSERTGLPYYGSKGLCGKKMIEDEQHTCIASIKANMTGRNLQQFARSLVVSAPPGNNVWEQLIGRTHRDGQRADEVVVDALFCCYEQWNVFRRAVRQAEYVERTMRQEQKLNFADVTVQDENTIAERHASGDPLWCKANAEFFETGGGYSLEELGLEKIR